MSFDKRYSQWIAAHVPTYEAAYGHCVEVTEAMQAAFPELTRVRGHYYCLVWGERAHWWLVTPDGAVVDPTARQFPMHGGVYVPWDDGREEPTGMCPNCGGACYDGAQVCSDQCAVEYTAYLYQSLR